jgi:hypothetical protein
MNPRALAGCLDLARRLHEGDCDLVLLTVSNEIAGAPEIPAPGLHFIMEPS